MLEARGLTKQFGGVTVVRNVSFSIARGEILGYLGPNGSGKSTTIKMIVGLLEPTTGTIHFDGLDTAADPVAFKSRLGYVPEEPHLYTHLTSLEYLMLVGRLRGLETERIARKSRELLRLFELDDARYATMSAYSKGMRQRVLLAAALLHDPDVLVLDEPFSGLDVSADVLFRTFLRALAEQGRAILFSSHRLDVVEKVCRRVVILHHGKVVADDTVAALRTNRSASLEDVFAEVTRQEDVSETVSHIVDVVRTW